MTAVICPRNTITGLPKNRANHVILKHEVRPAGDDKCFIFAGAVWYLNIGDAGFAIVDGEVLGLGCVLVGVQSFFHETHENRTPIPHDGSKFGAARAKSRAHGLSNSPLKLLTLIHLLYKVRTRTSQTYLRLFRFQILVCVACSLRRRGSRTLPGGYKFND